MPNWCTNQITISGEKENMKPIVDILREFEKDPDNDENHVMRGLIGPPTEEEAQKDEFYNGQVERYGTKWDFILGGEFGCNHYEITDDCITIDVYTAWSPPTNFLDILCKKYGVNAEITFSEPGCDFAGKCEYDKTGLYNDETYTYLEGIYKTGDYFWEELENLCYAYVQDEDGWTNLKEDLIKFLDESEMKQAEDLFNEVKVDEEISFD